MGLRKGICPARSDIPSYQPQNSPFLIYPILRTGSSNDKSFVRYIFRGLEPPTLDYNSRGVSTMNEHDCKGVHLKVHGRVQGVFYRQSTRDKAVTLGLRGWVRNEDDGTVVIQAFGDDTGLEQFIAWTKVGPPSATVTLVDIAWLSDAGDAPEGFNVRY